MSLLRGEGRVAVALTAGAFHVAWQPFIRCCNIGHKWLRHDYGKTHGADDSKRTRRG